MGKLLSHYWDFMYIPKILKYSPNIDLYWYFQESKFGKCNIENTLGENLRKLLKSITVPIIYNYEHKRIIDAFRNYFPNVKS